MTDPNNTSENVREALAVIQAFRTGGQTIVADVLDAAIEGLTAQNLSSYTRARQDVLQAVRRHVLGLTSAGSAGFQMQSAVLRALDRLDTGVESPVERALAYLQQMAITRTEPSKHTLEAILRGEMTA